MESPNLKRLKTIEIVRYVKRGAKAIPEEYHGYILAFWGNFLDENGNKIPNEVSAKKYNGVVWDEDFTQNISFKNLEDLKRFAKKIIAETKRDKVWFTKGAIEANAIFPVKYFPTDGKQAEWIKEESTVDLLRAI